MGYYSEFQEVTVILNGHNLEVEDAGQNVLNAGQLRQTVILLC